MANLSSGHCCGRVPIVHVIRASHFTVIRALRVLSDMDSPNGQGSSAPLTENTLTSEGNKLKVKK